MMLIVSQSGNYIVNSRNVNCYMFKETPDGTGVDFRADLGIRDIRLGLYDDKTEADNAFRFMVSAFESPAFWRKMPEQGFTKRRPDDGEA